MKPRANKAIKEFKPSFLILCEGETEQGYLNGMKAFRYKYIHVRIEPKLPKHPDYRDIFNYVQDNDLLKKSKGDKYSKVFCVFDMDTICKDGKTLQYNIDKQRIYKSDQEDRLEVIESRPCIEFWFLMHFDGRDRLLNNYEEIKPLLCKWLPDYCKEKSYSEKLYGNLEDRLDIAIERSIAICSKKREKGEDYSYTFMHKVIEELDKLLL